MSQAIDLIEELKLRRWARLNRRRLTERENDEPLHAIVLDELSVIQAEFAGREVSVASPNPIPTAHSAHRQLTSGSSAQDKSMPRESLQLL